MGRVPTDPAKLKSLLHRAWETGRNSWPQVDLDAGLFIPHLSRLLPAESEESPLPLLIERLDLEGLYLACACVNGVPMAIELLEKHYLARLPAVLGYLRLSAMVLDEVCQEVRTQLLVRTPDAEPRLADYTGRGALIVWIRVIAVRLAIRQGASIRVAPDDTALAMLNAVPAPKTDAEIALIQRRYHHDFRRAFHEAISTLTSDQRYLLRLRYIDELPTTKMGPLFAKNQSTISRWLMEARERLYDETKRLLKDRLRLSSQEFESLMSAILSNFDLSLSQFLNEGEMGEEA